MAPPESSVTRAALLRRGAYATGLVLAGVPALVVAAQSPEQEAEVLNLLLMVEYTEAAFYAQALDGGGLTGELRSFAEQVREHERAHLSLVQGVLGAAADPEPEYDFGDATRERGAFVDGAARLEDLAVAAYNGQAANVSPEAFAAAARIVSVEARHAAWIRSITDRDPAPRATDEPKTAAQVRAGLAQLGVRL
jgi:Ferritin-like domain